MPETTTEPVAPAESQDAPTPAPMNPTDRRRMVAKLRAEGLSIPKIASAVGASVGTVHADLKTLQPEHGAPEQPTSIVEEVRQDLAGVKQIVGSQVEEIRQRIEQSRKRRAELQAQAEAEEQALRQQLQDLNHSLEDVEKLEAEEQQNTARSRYDEAVAAYNRDMATRNGKAEELLSLLPRAWNELYLPIREMDSDLVARRRAIEEIAKVAGCRDRTLQDMTSPKMVVHFTNHRAFAYLHNGSAISNIVEFAYGISGALAEMQRVAALRDRFIDRVSDGQT